jgi:hypothetical protein
MNRTKLTVVAGAALAALLVGASPAAAATSPALGSAAPLALAGSTWTNTLNTPPQTFVVGNVCYTTPPATPPISVSGTTQVPCPPQVGLDQGSAIANINSQPCQSLGSIVALNAVSVNGGPPGVFPPGCYSSTGAMNITVGTSVTLNGAGTYIFRSGGAITSGANVQIVLANGACADNVFWTGIGAVTIGANNTFAGTILDDAGITIGHLSTLLGRALAANGTVTTDSDGLTLSSACFGGAGCGATSTAPTITPIAAQTVPVNGNATVTFSISGGVIASALALTSTSSNLTLVPQSAMQFGPPTASGVRTLSVTGADGRSGVATISVTVSDPITGCATTTTFLITIGATAVPTLPEWAMIALGGLLMLGGVVAVRRRQV